MCLSNNNSTWVQIIAKRNMLTINLNEEKEKNIWWTFLFVLNFPAITMAILSLRSVILRKITGVYTSQFNLSLLFSLSHRTRANIFFFMEHQEAWKSIASSTHDEHTTNSLRNDVPLEWFDKFYGLYSHFCWVPNKKKTLKVMTVFVLTKRPAVVWPTKKTKKQKHSPFHLWAEP